MRAVSRRLAWVRPLAAITVAALFVVPLYVAFVNVFKPSAEIVASPVSLPWPPTLDNITAVLSRPDRLFWDSLRTSVLLTTVSVVVVLTLSAMLAHYLARQAGAFGRVLLVVLLIGLMLPPQIFLGPITQVLRSLNMMGTIQGLLLFDVGYYMPFAVFVFMGFVRTIPRELEEAAELDGAGPLQAFWRIVFPLLRPARASVLIFLTVWIWNDFLSPLIILGPAEGTTITTGIYRAVGKYITDYGAIFALMFLASVPVLVFYLLMQKHFIKGLTGGSLKG